MLCRVPGGKSFLGCGTITTLPSSCLSFIWLPLWLTRTNPSFSSLLRTSLLFMSFLYATCATKSRENAYVAHRILLVTGYEKRRPRKATSRGLAIIEKTENILRFQGVKTGQRRSIRIGREIPIRMDYFIIFKYVMLEVVE